MYVQFLSVELVYPLLNMNCFTLALAFPRLRWIVFRNFSLLTFNPSDIFFSFLASSVTIDLLIARFVLMLVVLHHLQHSRFLSKEESRIWVCIISLSRTFYTSYQKLITSYSQI